MAVIIHGRGEEAFGFSLQAWIAVLQLAHDHGWQPAGTKPNVAHLRSLASPDTEGKDLDLAARVVVAEAVASWDGNYTSDNHQIVTAADAANLADGIERGLVRIPDAELRQNLRRVIAFCRAGSFVIA